MDPFSNFASVALLLFSAALDAHERDHDTGFASELYVTQPIGALNQSFTGRLGWGLALHIDENAWSRQRVRLSFAYADVNAHFLPGAPPSQHGRAHLSQFGAMLNCLHYLNNKRSGLYAIAGLGIREFRGEVPFPEGSQPTGSKSNPVLGETRYTLTTGTKLAYQVGGGYDFNNHTSLSLRFVASRSNGYTLGTVEAGWSHRF
jgi:hypothetical protein